MPDRPREMFRNGRPLDPVFEPTEDLYLRCSAEHVDVEQKHALPLAVTFTNQSVNRGKYSKPEWVLVPRWFDWGIAAFTVQDVPESLSSEGKVRYDFKVEHDPLEDNYAHSEIRTYKGGRYEPDAGKKVTKQVKLRFRTSLCEKARLIRLPKAP